MDLLTDMKAWVNGEICPLGQARVPVYDMGVFMGSALAEALRTFNWKPFRMARHLDRLERSMRGIGLQPPVARAEMERITLEVIELARQVLPAGSDVSVNYYVSSGGMLGGKPLHGFNGTVVVWAVPIGFGMLGKQLENGLGLVIPATRQLPADCITPRIKHRNRLHFTLADREARKVDTDSMAVLLDLHGRLTECSSANVFVVKNGCLFTPTTSVCLAGESRACVLELARKMGIPAEEKDLQPYDLEVADEAFITATSRCLTPAVRINTRPIGTGKPGPMVDRLLAAWSELVGMDIRAQMTQKQEEGR